MKHVVSVNGVTAVYEDGEPSQEKKVETGEEMIMRFERESGCRVDSNNFDNDAIGGIMGFMARALGKSNHRPEDDALAGIIIRHQISPAGQAEREGRAALAAMLTSGMSPDDIHDLGTVLKDDKQYP